MKGRKVTDGNQSKDIASQRLASIDALRGFDMFWIIGGAVFFRRLAKVWPNSATEMIKQQVSHVSWKGFHFQDLIFPLFLFIVGVTLPFALARRAQRGQSRGGLYLHILKRSLVLILLGMMMNGLLKFEFADMRWPGVLQRIGICYFFAALVVMHTKWPTQAIVVAAVLLLYWAALALVPVPGFGAGVITPAGCLPTYIDQQLLGGNFIPHYYGYGDSEGIISTLPAICTVLLGSLAGHWLRSDNSPNRKTLGLAAAALACLVAGYNWGQVFPVIKNIWTSSYVLVAGGWSLLLLALFYWVIDVKGYKKWAFFFIVIGANPITIYFLQSFVNFGGIAEFFAGGIAQYAGLVKPVVLALAVLGIKWLFLGFLYQRRIFFKV